MTHVLMFLQLFLRCPNFWHFVQRICPALMYLRMVHLMLFIVKCLFNKVSSDRWSVVLNNISEVLNGPLSLRWRASILILPVIVLNVSNWCWMSSMLVSNGILFMHIHGRRSLSAPTKWMSSLLPKYSMLYLSTLRNEFI